MKITATQTSDLTQKLALTLVEEDYAPVRKKRLSEFRKTVDIKGFRKGMVPASLVEKMFGERALYEAVNEVINSSIASYIQENKLQVVGEALPAEDTPQQELVMGGEFNFTFDIAVNPTFDFELTEKDVVPQYVITPDKDAAKTKKDALLKQFGSLAEAKEAGEEDFLTADFVAGEEQLLDAYVAIRQVSAECKDQFVGIAVGETREIEIAKAFTNEADRAAMFKVKKEELDTLAPVWTMTVKSVKTFAPAKACVETYDKIFGEGVVKNADEFNAKIADMVKEELAGEASFRLSNDVKAYILEKSKVQVAEDFLKRWITLTNEKVTPEQIEAEFPAFIEDYKWTVVRNYLASKFEVSASHDDLVASAKGFARYQYAMYGMNNIPEEYIDRFAQDMLKDEKQADRIYEAVIDEKVISAAKAKITLKETKITDKKFRELK